MLITCRLELPGIATFKLKSFDFPTSKRYFYNFRKEKGDEQVSDDFLKQVFDHLKNNPFCLSLLSHNMKAGFQETGQLIISKLG